MCVPLIAAGVAIAASVASTAQQSSNAKAQMKLQNRVAARNRNLAARSAANQYTAISERTAQEEIKAGIAAQRVSADALAARARVRAAAGESGVSGASVNALLNDFGRQEGEYLAATRTNMEFAKTQAEIEKTAIQQGYEGRLISTTPDFVPTPNLYIAALGAFSAGLGAYAGGVQAGGSDTLGIMGG